MALNVSYWSLSGHSQQCRELTELGGNRSFDHDGSAGRDAPIPVIRRTTIGRPKSTEIGHSAPWTASAGMPLSGDPR